MISVRNRIARPTPKIIRAARKAADLTQTQATALVSEAQGTSAYRGVRDAVSSGVQAR